MKNIDIYDHRRYCKNTCCKWEKEDRRSFRFIIVEGGMKRVQLQRTGLNVFTCPKCGISVVTEEFVNKEFEEKNQARKKQIRMEQLRIMYGH